MAYWPEEITKDIVSERHFGYFFNVYHNRPRSLIEVLYNSVNYFPSHEALVCDNKRLTYSQFQDLVDRMAYNFAVRWKIRANDRVAILFDNSVEFCICIMATMQIGAIGVPLNVRLQAPEICYMLNHSQARVLLTDEKQWLKVKNNRKYLPYLETVFLNSLQSASDVENYDSLILSKEPERIVAEVDEEDIALIVYTSGTTGVPKGAKQTHINIIHTLINYQRIMGTDCYDRTLIAVPLFHVTGLMAQLLLFINIGGTSVIMKNFKTEKFIELIEREKITHTIVVPTIYSFMLNHPQLEQVDLSSLQIAAYGGAPMSKDTIIQLNNKLPWLQLYNCYGATETTSPATILPAKNSLKKADSVGLPVPVGEVKVCDESGKDLGPNRIGELWIKGPMVIPGYWENKEATEEGFLNGYWLSGDLAKIDDEGYVYIMGRKKEMISRGGEKIYPVEIENILCSHSKVLEVAVVGVLDPVFGERVKAVIVTIEGEELTEAELKDFLNNKIARYKIPEFFCFVSELPRNPGGKVLKNKLKDL